MCVSTTICLLVIAAAIFVEAIISCVLTDVNKIEVWKGSAFLAIGVGLFVAYLNVICSLLQFIRTKDE